MIYVTLSSVILNATIHTNAMLGQVVKLKYCVIHQIVGPANSRFTNNNQGM
jgi:hypothetical protein